MASSSELLGTLMKELASSYMVTLTRREELLSVTVLQGTDCAVDGAAPMMARLRGSPRRTSCWY